MAIDRADWHWETAEKEFREKNGITGEEDYARLKAKIETAYEGFVTR